MNVHINITSDNKNNVIIQDKSEYLPETPTGRAPGEFRFSETVSIDVIQLNKLKETLNKDIVYTLHDERKDIIIPIKFDGHFTVTHIILPSKEWFLNEIDKESNSDLWKYNITYFSDGITVYKYVQGNVYEATVDELLLLNPIKTTVSRLSRDYVSIGFLLNCYINLCKLIFNDRGFSSCWNKSKVDSELVFKRDLVWMAINVIKYLTELNLLMEVQRIIENITSCNGLCANNITSTTNGCGCT